MNKKILFLFSVLLLLIIQSCNNNKTPSAPDTSNNNVLPTFSATATRTFTATVITTLTSTVTFSLTVVPDIYEEDDTPQQAKSIISGANQTRSIDACNEQDWIKFTLFNSSNVEIITSSQLPTYIEIFADENKNNFIADAGDGVNSAQITINNLQAGTYYANIRAYNYAAPGCDVFNYYLAFNIITLTPTPYFTETFTETHTKTFTFTYTFTVTQTETEKETNTETPQNTFTHTSSFTPSFTPTYDIYEPDNTISTAKVITNNESQLRNFWPYGNYDFISFYLPASSDIYVQITTTADYNFMILNSLANSIVHPIYGLLSYNKTGNFYLSVNLNEGDYYFLLIGNNLSAIDYSINFSFITHTPTITLTSTNTETPTHTFTFTVTSTPTQTSTRYWYDVAQYGSNNSGYLSIDENGSDYSLSFMNSGTLYVDSYTVTTAATGAFLASRDMIKKLSNKTFVVFSDYKGDIFVKTSENNFIFDVGGTLVGVGYYPCIESNGTTIFVAYTDIQGGTDMRTSVKCYSQGYSWTYYGGNGGVYNQSDTTQRRLSMDGYYTGMSNDIYVAYITEANAGIYVKHNLDNTGWQQVGSSYVTYANTIKDVEISVIDPLNIFVAYSRNNPYSDIYVKKLQAGDWEYAGTNPVVGTATVGNVEFSLYAVAPDEVYLAFQHPDTQKAVVKKYNGIDWEYVGSEGGFSEGTIGIPNIFKLSNKIYCGFVDWAKNGRVNLMAFD